MTIFLAFPKKTKGIRINHSGGLREGAEGPVRPGPLVLGDLEMAASSLGQIVNKPLKTPSAYIRGSLGLEAP